MSKYRDLIRDAEAAERNDALTGSKLVPARRHDPMTTPALIAKEELASRAPTAFDHAERTPLMRSTVTLRVEINHHRNLAIDAQGVANRAEGALLRQLTDTDPLLSVKARVIDAMITSQHPDQRLHHPLTPGSLVIIDSPAGSQWQGQTGQVDRVEEGSVFVKLFSYPTVLPFGLGEVAN